MSVSVCHVVNTFNAGSPAADLSQALLKDTQIDTIGVLAWFEHNHVEALDTVDVHHLNPNRRFFPSRETLNEAKTFLQRYDIVQTYNPHSAFFSKLLARKNRQAIISREGNDHSSFTRKGRLSNGVTNVFADRVVCVSESVRDSFMGWENLLLRDNQVKVIYNGVDIESVIQANNLDWSILDEYPIGTDSVVVGHAARFVPQKAQDVLIRALARANRESNQKLELVLAGNGPLRQDLERIAVSEGMSENVHFLGMLDRPYVYKMMHDSDIYAMPSRWEGFCMAVLQAMAASTPCVLTDIPSFEPFEDVAVFVEKDDVNTLADVIIELASSKPRRYKFGERGQGLVEAKYSITKTAREYAELYEEIL